MNLGERVREIVGRIMQVPTEQIDEASSPESIEAWDSLKHMYLILALEEEFDVRFTDKEILQMIRVGAIVERLRELP